MKYLVTFILSFSFSQVQSEPLNFLEAEVLSLKDSNPERILFVGNSYLYYNDSLHNHVRRMAEEMNPERKDFFGYKSATIGGSRLSHHNLEHLLESKNIGIDESFQLVILQGGSEEVLDEESRKSFNLNAKKMIEQIENSGAEALLYMIHAYVPPHELYDPKMIEKIRYTYLKAANDYDAMVAPIGIAYMNAYKANPDIKLHKFFDGTHPNILGTYLSACVLYATIFKKPSSEVQYNYFGAISNEDQKFLQKIADETVKEFFKR